MTSWIQAAATPKLKAALDRLLQTAVDRVCDVLMAKIRALSSERTLLKVLTLGQAGRARMFQTEQREHLLLHNSQHAVTANQPIHSGQVLVHASLIAGKHKFQ